MTIKIIDLVESTKKEIKNQEDFIEALKELKVINGLTHRQHAKINKVLKEHNLNARYTFEYYKKGTLTQACAFLRNLENNKPYFYATSDVYREITITSETIKNANLELNILKEAHNFALEIEAEIKKQHELYEDSKKKIVEAMKYNKKVANEFNKRFKLDNVSLIYINEDSDVTISIY